MQVINLYQKIEKPIDYSYNFSFSSDIELTEEQKRKIAKTAYKKMEKIIKKITKEKINKYDVATYVLKKKA